MNSSLFRSKTYVTQRVLHLLCQKDGLSSGLEHKHPMALLVYKLDNNTLNYYNLLRLKSLYLVN